MLALKNALRIRPEWVAAHLALAESLAELGLDAEAVAEFESAQALDPRCLDDPDERALYEGSLQKTRE